MTDTATPTSAGPDLEQFEAYRSELTGYCYRMLGSAFEADDAVQETMVKAWRKYDTFEGRSSLRSWLYRIATNVCLDMLRGRARRAMPIDMADEWGGGPELTSLPAGSWVDPESDLRAIGADPGDVVAAHESVRMALVAALQHLPARQRAVLVLREVLRWPAADVADLLDTSVQSVNSSLQRARANLEAARAVDRAPVLTDPDHHDLLARYVEAFERWDMDALVEVLTEDATQTMPPYALCVRGPRDLVRWWTEVGFDCEGSIMVPVAANGSVGFAQYRPNQNGPGFHAWSIQGIELTDGRVSAMIAYLDTGLFGLFGLPTEVTSRAELPAHATLPALFAAF